MSASNAGGNGSPKTKLKDYGISRKELEQENFDLIAKVRELLHTHDLWEDDDTYTFSDGERWYRLREIYDDEVH